MSQWRIERSSGGYRLERSREGLARVVCPGEKPGTTTSYGVALSVFLKATQPLISKRAALLVHGLMGDGENFRPLALALSEAGFATGHARYASSGRDWRSASAHVSRHIKAGLLIGHSLGCRIIADALPPQPVADLKIVMLAPPVAPVRWAQRGAKIAPVRRLLGPALQDLAYHWMPTDRLSAYDVLVLEGGGKRAHDGWLSSNETQLPFAHQRYRLSSSHSGLVDDPETCRHVLAFAA